MAQTKDENKRVAIRDALIADVVENGLGKAPISQIARRAGVSNGTIYIYYPNKDEMLQSVFVEIKSLLHGTMMGAYREARTNADAIRSMWFAMFNFILQNPDMFAFHETVAAENFLNSAQQEKVLSQAGEIHLALQSAVDDGTLKDMPMDCLISLLLAPAVSLARRMLSNGSKDITKADHVFQAIWDGIAK